MARRTPAPRPVQRSACGTAERRASRCRSTRHTWPGERRTAAGQRRPRPAGWSGSGHRRDGVHRPRTRDRPADRWRPAAGSRDRRAGSRDRRAGPRDRRAGRTIRRAARCSRPRPSPVGSELARAGTRQDRGADPAPAGTWPRCRPQPIGGARRRMGPDHRIAVGTRPAGRRRGRGDPPARRRRPGGPRRRAGATARSCAVERASVADGLAVGGRGRARGRGRRSARRGAVGRGGRAGPRAVPGPELAAPFPCWVGPQPARRRWPEGSAAGRRGTRRDQRPGGGHGGAGDGGRHRHGVVDQRGWRPCRYSRKHDPRRPGRGAGPDGSGAPRWGSPDERAGPVGIAGGILGGPFRFSRNGGRW